MALPPGDAGTDLPEAASRRLAAKSFSSGLSVADFAACLHMGMRPVGLVQGFCAMGWNPAYYMPSQTTYGTQWQGYNTSWSGWGDVLGTYTCPHRIIYTAEHPSRGFNVEATGIESVWAEGYNTTFRRMLEEAEALGAHGVIGVVDATKSLIGPYVREFHLLGTAVVLDRQPAPEQVWSTYLAGSKLGKLLEAGLMPLSIVGAFAAVTVLPSCVTEIQEHGRYDNYGVVPPYGEITQLADAHTDARRLVRDHLKSVLGDGALHGADLQVTEDNVVGRTTINAIMRGTKVRRFKDVDPLPMPVPTVHLS
jgi:uncharacterized protein YbjQ (UPF0145 family)